MKKLLLSLFSLATFVSFGQGRISFHYTDTVQVKYDGAFLSLPWAGGFNNPQFGKIDLNLDGELDILVFDRSGNRWIPFESSGGSNPTYTYAPQHIENLPEIKEWMVLADFNCDGKVDIFHHVNAGIGLYENTSSGGSLSFSWALGTDPFIKSLKFGNYSNLYVLSSDIPAIVDIDNDGDLDILTFDQGNTVHFNENSANCGLNFEQISACWGGFAENANNNSVTLNSCTPKTEGKTQHQGSTLLVKDLDGNGAADCLLGDVSFTNATAVYNTGTSFNADMTSQDSTFPKLDIPVDLYLFPAFFDLDVNNDGENDIIVAPNINGSKNTENTWLYENMGTPSSPNYQRTSTGFLQEDMLDFGEGSKPTFVDLNTDGKKDLVVSSKGKFISSGVYESKLIYFINTGTILQPKFELENSNLGNIGNLSIGTDLHPAFADLTSDGLNDLVLGSADGKLIYFKNTGTFTSPQFTLTDANFLGLDFGANSTPYFFDIDDDGNVDLFVGEESGNINYLKGQGGINFTYENEFFGGINVSSGSFQGYSVPSFAVIDSTVQLMVGSSTFGVIQYDSILSVFNNQASLEYTLGTDTTSSTGFEQTPLGTSKRTGRNQILFRASELLAAGYTRGKITDISLEVVTSGNPPMTQGLTISFKNTTSNSITGFETGMTEAFNLATGFNQGWNNIPMTIPFEWDGTSNLLVEFCFSKNYPQTTIPVKMSSTSFPSNGYGDITNWNTNTAKGCLMPYKAAVNNRPNMKLKITPTVTRIDHVLKDGYRNAADFTDLNHDGIPDAILGNLSGGLTLFYGGEYNGISVPEYAETKTINFDVFPNPGYGSFTIELNEVQGGEKNMRIYNLNGQLLYSTSFYDLRKTIDVDYLKAGLYIIEVTGDDWKGFSRWVKM